MVPLYKYFWRSWGVRVGVFCALILIVGGYVCYRMGWYPLVYVNGTAVWASEYRMSLRLTHNFYSSIAKQTKMRVPQNTELEKIVFDGLVDDILMTDELHTQMTPRELDQKTEEQVDAMISSGDGRIQMLALTQESESDSRIYLLNHIARGQLLTDLFTLQQKEILPWLMEQRNNTHIIFVGASGVWNGEKGYEKDL
ncbi:MAG: hypothetical protein WC099_01040 [Candidatus Paceibacterota bacterium]